jgi:hypothetical protein
MALQKQACTKTCGQRDSGLGFTTDHAMDETQQNQYQNNFRKTT